MTLFKLSITENGGANYDPVTLGFIDYDYSISTTLWGTVRIWNSQGVVITKIFTDEPEQFDDEHPIPKRMNLSKDCCVIGNIHANPELLEEIS